MRKVALVFVLAVLIPSLVLAWLAARSLRDQQFVLERQQALLYQNVSDSLADKVRNFMSQKQQEFDQEVERILADQEPRQAARTFDQRLCAAWPAAQVGFAVTLEGKILAPDVNDNAAARRFRSEYGYFLANKELAEVYPQITMGNNLAANGYNLSEEKIVIGSDEGGSKEQEILDGKIQTEGVSRRETSPPPNQADVSVAEISGDTPKNSKRAMAGASQSAPADKKFQSEKAGTKIQGGLASEAMEPQAPPAESLVFGEHSFGQAIAQAKRSEDDAAQTHDSQNKKDFPAATKPSSETGSYNSFDSIRQDSAKFKKESPVAASAPAYLSEETELKSGRLDYLAGNASRKANIQRSVSPLKQLRDEDNTQQISKIAPSEAEFRQVVGEATSGAVARFVQNQLSVLVWHRSPRDPQLVFGAQLNLPHLIAEVAKNIPLEPDLEKSIVVGLLDDHGTPRFTSRDKFNTNWKRPFVATEIGEILPHWELAVYLINPDQLNEAARTLRLTLGSMVALMVLAIGFGSALIALDVRRHIALARQKTDFVSNVSHELKTPLTSIRMFSELLAEGRVTDEVKRQSYLGIITAEASRLTRLINNVLDFARLERGEKKYNSQSFDFAELVSETVAHYRPHLETMGYHIDYHPPGSGMEILGDRDAMAQVIVNLISNAEKYGGEAKEIALELAPSTGGRASFKVLDRGQGVPKGAETRIFEQFYRAHDSLDSGIQGSGLGLTLARQIARAHGGEITYQPRKGGGSCFCLELPLLKSQQTPPL